MKLRKKNANFRFIDPVKEVLDEFAAEQGTTRTAVVLGQLYRLPGFRQRVMDKIKQTKEQHGK